MSPSSTSFLRDFANAWSNGPNGTTSPTVLDAALSCALVFQLKDRIYERAHGRPLSADFYMFAISCRTGEAVAIEPLAPHTRLFDLARRFKIATNDYISVPEVVKDMEHLVLPDGRLIKATLGVLEWVDLGFTLRLYSRPLVDLVVKKRAWKYVDVPHKAHARLKKQCAEYARALTGPNDYNVDIDVPQFVSVVLETSHAHKNNACAACNAPLLAFKGRRCSGCLAAWYCDERCQKLHRLVHKSDCKMLAGACVFDAGARPLLKELVGGAAPPAVVDVTEHSTHTVWSRRTAL